MAREFVNPNLHVALVHFPLGLLIVGTLIELFSFMWRRHAFRAAGRWMILLGALSGIPTAFAGIYALADVTRIGLAPEDAQGTWAEVSGRSPLWRNKEQGHLLRDHVALQSWGTGVAVLIVVTWMGSSDRWRAKLHLPLLALLIISTALAIAGSWHAGEAVYRHGTGVELAPATQPSLAELAREEGVAAPLQKESKSGIEYFIPPLQTHMIMGGFTVAIALTAVGLSFRAANAVPPRTEVDYIAAALGPPGEVTEKRHTRDREPPDRLPRVPTSRFWLLSVGLGVLTAFAGLWALGAGTDIFNPAALWEVLSLGENPTRPWLTRRIAHVGGGSSIIVLSLLMAVVARIMPRARIIIILFSLLLLLAVAAQIWFGVLLTYDTLDGPVTRFN